MKFLHGTLANVQMQWERMCAQLFRWILGRGNRSNAEASCIPVPQPLQLVGKIEKVVCGATKFQEETMANRFVHRRINSGCPTDTTELSQELEFLDDVSGVWAPSWQRCSMVPVGFVANINLQNYSSWCIVCHETRHSWYGPRASQHDRSKIAVVKWFRKLCALCPSE